jgi:hypothetical protein
LNVTPPDGSASFRSAIQATVSRVSIPRAGDRLTVAYHTDKPIDIMLVK